MTVLFFLGNNAYMSFCNCTLQLQPAFITHVSNAVHAGNPS